MAVVILAGCGKSEPESDAKSATANPGPPPTNAAVKPADGPVDLSFVPDRPAGLDTGSTAIGNHDLRIVSEQQFDQFLAERRGKTLVVDAWATWCGPCRQKFPLFVELARQYSPKIHFASVSFDETDDADQARDFLDEQNAEFDNLLLDAELAHIQDRFGFVGLPQYLVFDPQGAVKFRTSNIEELQQHLASP